MNSEPSSSPWKQFAGTFVIVIGLFLTVRLLWQAWEGRRQGRAMTTEEFHDAVREQFARDRANFERDWIASGKPIPPGGFDAMFRIPETPRAAPESDPALAAPPASPPPGGEGGGGTGP